MTVGPEVWEWAPLFDHVPDLDGKLVLSQEIDGTEYVVAISADCALYGETDTFNPNAISALRNAMQRRCAEIAAR